MKIPEKATSEGLTRRDALKLSGLALGGLAVGGVMGGPGASNARADCSPHDPCYPVDISETQRYTYFELLPLWMPGTRLRSNEMRITFLGSAIPPVRRAQQMMSVFVEVGDAMGEADQFVFDCGSGVCANYGAMGIGFGRMDKIFLAHLHGDHMSDLTHIYCFGPSADRKSPLFVWGPGPSGVRTPAPESKLYNDGTMNFCKHFREAMRWHSESFSFQSTSYKSYKPPTRKSWGLPVDPIPVGDDKNKDAYALIPIELDWRKYGKEDGDNVAYNNPKTGVKITHFPVIHCRQGSIGYKLEWNGMSVIYTSDTKPETHCVEQAINGGNGVDVLVHEMIVPPEIWAMKTLRLPEPLPYPGPDWWKNTVDGLTRVQNSSHSPQGGFGYLLSQINPRPRLTVATHFPVADDTVACALKSVQAHCPDVQLGRDIIWSFDNMVLTVSKSEIKHQRGLTSDYGWSPKPNDPDDLNTPKYWTWGVDEDGHKVKVGDPFAQIDQSTAIQPTNPDGTVNYCDDGY